LSRRVSATAESWPPRHRRDVGTTAWRCGLSPFNSSSRLLVEKGLGAPDLLIDLRTGYSDDDVVALFAEVAPITSAQVVMDDDGRSRGYGFVEIEVAADAEKLIGEFHGSDVGGRDLIVRPGKQSGGDGGGGRGRARAGARARTRRRARPWPWWWWRPILD
jgi:cold-inducible RNA-binding protein